MAGVQDYVATFNNLVVPAAVELYGIDYFTAFGEENPDGRQAQERLNEFGPFELENGDTRVVDMTNAAVQNAVGSLWTGAGGDAAKKFLDAVKKFVGDAPLESVYETASDPQIGLDQMLPLRTSTAKVPPPDPDLQTTEFTADEFTLLFSLMASYSELTFNLQTEGEGVTALGDKYTFRSRKDIRRGRDQDQYYLAVTQPVLQDGKTVLAPLTEQPASYTQSYFNLGNFIPYSVIKNLDIKPVKRGSPLKPDDSPFRANNALYINVPGPGSLTNDGKMLSATSGKGAYFQLARLIAVNHQEALKDVAFDVVRKIFKDTVRQARAEQFTKNPLSAAFGELDETFHKKVPARRKLTPNDFQCFLLERISELSAVHNPEYKHTVMVDTNSQPALITNAVNHTPKKTAQARTLLNLCPDVYGALVPYIRLSRVEYDNKGKILPNSEKELEIPNFLRKSDVEKILKGDLGRAPGAGIKSFSWSLAGVQPAEVDNNITAKLDIYFQTVADFFAGGSDQAGKKNPSFLDLIIASPTITDPDAERSQGQSLRSKPGKCLVGDELHRQYDGVNFRIKVCAGWATPDNMSSMFPNMSSDDEAALESALESTRVSLYLQQVRHNIDFQQDGSVTLSIEYQASLSGLLKGSGSDIFATTERSVKTELTTTTKKQEELEAKRLELKEAGASSAQMKGVEEALEDTVKRLREIREEDKLQKYRKLLDNLFASNKVYSLPISAQELLITPYADLTPLQRAERAKRRKSQSVKVTDAKGQVYDLLAEVARAKTTEAAAEGYSKTASKKFLDIPKEYTGDPADTISIPFFYLGDLIDNVLEQIKDNNGGALDFNFFLSDVEMVDPLLALQFKNIEELVACGTLKNINFLTALIAKEPIKYSEFAGIAQLMNIGDIPISLDAFQLWFKNNVVAKGRSKYLFLHFVKDICNGLITKALRSICFGPTLNFEQRFDAQPLTLATHASIRPGSVVNVKTLARARQNLTCEEKVSKLGLILMPTDSRPKNLKGLFEPDLRRGIYHNYLGSSCGLVKTINFNREDQPYLRESKIQKDGVLGAEQLRELYSAQIEMVGNNLYQNGAYTYISPLLLPSTKKQLELLGLNGYYLVTSVASTITDQSFNTVVHALHEGVKFNENQLIAPETYAGLTSEELDKAYWNMSDPATREGATSADKGPPTRVSNPIPKDETPAQEKVRTDSRAAAYQNPAARYQGGR